MILFSCSTYVVRYMMGMFIWCFNYYPYKVSCSVITQRRSFARGVVMIICIHGAFRSKIWATMTSLADVERKNLKEEFDKIDLHRAIEANVWTKATSTWRFKTKSKEKLLLSGFKDKPPCIWLLKIETSLHLSFKDNMCAKAISVGLLKTNRSSSCF